MSEVNLSGLGVALVTPFKKDLSIDYEALEKILENIIEGGADYIVALGTTAETPTLTLEERSELCKFLNNKTKGKIPMVIGIGGNNTLRVIRDINRTDLSGFSAILSVTPFYNRPSQEGLFQHYKAIADISPLPLILYNVPSRTGVNLSAHTTLKLTQYSSKIIAIKEASGKMEQCKEILDNAPETFSVISGDDAYTSDLMKIGAVGVISVLANACPREVKQLVDLCLENRFKEAEISQQELAPLISGLFADGNPSGVKALLNIMGLSQNILRLPLVPVRDSVFETLKLQYSAIQNR
ncbi:MAG: 4-hydroxy-tetrahydrodipicolinate synthase [Muribaculaceae bacterium]|nr:4-hydroxy-tetrahydrodipicolinate synthase [Muribaculaceae bacterium]